MHSCLSFKTKVGQAKTGPIGHWHHPMYSLFFILFFQSLHDEQHVEVSLYWGHRLDCPTLLFWLRDFMVLICSSIWSFRLVPFMAICLLPQRSSRDASHLTDAQAPPLVAITIDSTLVLFTNMTISSLWRLVYDAKRLSVIVTCTLWMKKYDSLRWERKISVYE